LILIRHIEVIPRLFDRVAVPNALQVELSNRFAPPLVRNWIAAPPAWLEIHDSTTLPKVSGLDEGETEAIALAEFLNADLLLIDERAGFRAAKKLGLRVTGTIGLLDLAAERGLVDFADAIRKLSATSFRRPETLLKSLLAKHNRSTKR